MWGSRDSSKKKGASDMEKTKEIEVKKEGLPGDCRREHVP